MEAAVERQVTFEEFYRAERANVLRAVLFTLDDRDLAVEATDEAMLRAFERWGDVAGMGNPTGWVFRVAVNFARNRIRRRVLERNKPVSLGMAVADLGTVADPALARAIARLPLDQRAVVVLRFHLDWSVEEVAEALGIANGTVKSRLHRALRRLEKLLKEPT